MQKKMKKDEEEKEEKKRNKNSVVLVRKRTIPIERSPPVSEANANFSG
jgi:hypothetical protein